MPKDDPLVGYPVNVVRTVGRGLDAVFGILTELTMVLGEGV